MTDREKLEYLTYLAYDKGIVSASWCKDLLDFRYMNDFRDWLDNYDIDAVARRHSDACLKKYYKMMGKI